MMRRTVLTGVVVVAMVLAVACGKSAGDDDAHEPKGDAGKQATDVARDLANTAPDLPPEVEQADTAEPPPAVHEVPIGDMPDLTFHVGPHVMHTTASSVILIWESETAGSSRVEFGPDTDYGNTAEGEVGTMHEVTVTDLKPATIYHYRACTGDTCTGDLTFATAPLPGQKFRFAVYGDSRSNPETHAAVAANVVKDDPVVVFNVGDVVGDGIREQYKEEHFDPTRLLGHYVPIYVAIGNHEWKEADALGTEDVPNFRDYMAFPEFPELRIQELSYAFTFGDAFFLVLDNTLDGGDLFFTLAGVEMPLAKWLREQVESEAAANSKWRFAFMHYPPPSACEEDGGMMVTATANEVIPMLKENGFHALFAGHVHDYERHDFDGFPVIVSGGGGAGLQDVTECEGETPDELVKIESVNHHLTIDLGDDTAHVRAVNLGGEVFDEITIPQQ